MAVSSHDGVDRPIHSFIEAITHSSIDEKGTMGTQWSRHRVRWRREECEQEGGRKEKRPRTRTLPGQTHRHAPTNQPPDRPTAKHSHEAVHRRTEGDEGNANNFLVVVERVGHLQLHITRV